MRKEEYKSWMPRRQALRLIAASLTAPFLQASEASPTEQMTPPPASAPAMLEPPTLQKATAAPVQPTFTEVPPSTPRAAMKPEAPVLPADDIPKVESESQDHGFVEARGTELFLDGKPQKFLGFNRYNLMREEGNGCGNIFPENDRKQFFKDIKAMGANALRLWMGQDYTMKGFAVFDEMLGYAKDEGIYVIPVLANHWSDCDPDITAPQYEVSEDDRKGSKTPEWYTTGNSEVAQQGQLSYRQYVAAFAERYANETNILAIEPVNEPESIDPESLRAFFKDITQVIREKDKNHLISTGTIGGGQPGIQGEDYGELHKIPDIGIVSAHDYDDQHTIPGDEFNGIKIDMEIAKRLNRPFMIGELGIPTDKRSPAERAEIIGEKLEAYYSNGASIVLLWSARDAVDQNTGKYMEDAYAIISDDPLVPVMKNIVAKYIQN